MGLVVRADGGGPRVGPHAAAPHLVIGERGGLAAKARTANLLRPSLMPPGGGLIRQRRGVGGEVLLCPGRLHALPRRDQSLDDHPLVLVPQLVPNTGGPVARDRYSAARSIPG